MNAHTRIICALVYIATLALLAGAGCTSSGGGGGNKDEPAPEESSACADEPIYFFGSDATYGGELWVLEFADCALADIRMVKDIQQGSFGGISSINMEKMERVGDTIFFPADDGTTGEELWKSDGTEAGTSLVANLNPSGWSFPNALTEVGGALYLQANNGVDGGEPYMTDGQTMTPLGPLNPTGSSFPQSFIESDGKIYFSATDGGSVVGWELWEWNGVASTAINLNPGTADSIPSYLAVAGGKLFMNADIGAEGRELVVVDTGSPASVNINTGGGLSSTPANLVEWNGLVYFSADDGTNDYQLWSSNGGAVGSGTAIALGPIAEIGWGPQYFLTPMGDFMLLVAEHTGYGHEWFRFENGALTLVKDIYSGPSGSFPERPLSAEGNLYFLADDGTGYDLWRTDGTEAGTINLLEPAGLGPMNSCNETVLGVYEGVVYLALDSDADFSAELWRTDGTAEGTERLGEVIVEYYDPSCD